MQEVNPPLLKWKTCPVCVSKHLYSNCAYSFFTIQTFQVSLDDRLPQRVLLPADDESLQAVVQLRTEFRTVTGAGSARLELQVFGCSEGGLSLHLFQSQQGPPCPQNRALFLHSSRWQIELFTLSFSSSPRIYNRGDNKSNNCRDTDNDCQRRNNHFPNYNI